MVLILSGLLIPVRQIFIILGILATILTWIGFYLSPENEILWIVITNRVYAMVAIWVTVFILSLKRKEKSLREEIAWRNDFEAKLYKTIKSSEDANKSKTEFLASMSHDLRTPLNAIIGFSEMIEKRTFGEDNFEKYFEYAGDIHKSSQYLLQLINDILDVSKLESGNFDLNKRETNLDEIINSCYNLLNKSALDKEINLEFDVSDSLEPFFADPLAIKQILINIVSNSIKFTPAGGIVYLKAEEVDNHQVIIISDNGVGISEKALKTITQPFIRDDENTKKFHEGTGLGLSIVKALVRLHDGELRIESTLGEGTTVTIILPDYQD